MFRKIHSNREPGATLYSEIRKEFGSYFGKISEGAKALLQTHPWKAFYAMLFLMLLSLGLSFTVFRQPTPKQRITANPASSHSKRPGLDDGFSRILATGAALQQTLHLKTEVESLLDKGRLSSADSLALEKALDSLQQIHHHINHVP